MLPLFFGMAEAMLKDRPVSKVVNLLKDMKVELEKELADDKKVNEMLTCWCTKNNEEKTQAIELGESTAAQLEADLDSFTASMNGLKAQRVETQNELEANRAKENQAFHKEETFLLDATYACKQALTVLSEYHPQLAQVHAVARRLHDARVTQLALASGKVRKEQLDALQTFMRQAEGASSFVAI